MSIHVFFAGCSITKDLLFKYNSLCARIPNFTILQNYEFSPNLTFYPIRNDQVRVMAIEPGRLSVNWILQYSGRIELTCKEWTDLHDLKFINNDDE